MSLVVLIVRVILAAVFTIAGIAKLADSAGARKSLTEFGAPAFLAPWMARLLPLVELACSVALLRTAWSIWGAGGILGMLLVFTAVIGISLARGRRPACHCFGQRDSSPIGGKTLARNGVLSAMAAFVLWQGPQSVDPGAVWASLNRPESDLPLIAVTFAVLLALQMWALVHVLRQNGRLLLRIDAIEARLGKEEHPVVEGLPLKTEAPRFSLAGLDGEIVTLDKLLETGKALLLIFVEPGCGPCEALLPDVARWQTEFQERLLTVPISRGDLKANLAKRQEHRLQNTLLQKDREVAMAYLVNGTPGAVLVRDGKIASHVAGGDEAIRALVHRATLPPPLKKGDLVPSLPLPDLDGKTVDIAQLRGRRRLLVFWNPECSYCQAALEDLKNWERNSPQGAPDLLLISKGSVESNRAQGFRARVLLDEKFQLGQVFDSEGTPSGVLLDEDGRVASDMGTGHRRILELASNGQ